MPVNAPVLNLAVFQGTDRSWDDQIVGADGVTPVDISGWTVVFVVHAYGDPGTIYFTKTNGNGVSLSNPGQGVLTFSVSATDTAGMFPGEYSYYIERTDPGNDDVLTRGLFTVQRRSGYDET